MKIKTILMAGVLMICLWHNISTAEMIDDAVLAESFAKCSATVATFVKSMPSLELPVPTAEQEYKLNQTIGNYALAAMALVGKDKTKEMVQNQLLSAVQVAEAAFRVGDGNAYATYAGQETKQCMKLLESNMPKLKPKMESIANEYYKKDN